MGIIILAATYIIVKAVIRVRVRKNTVEPIASYRREDEREYWKQKEEEERKIANAINLQMYMQQEMDRANHFTMKSITENAGFINDIIQESNRNFMDSMSSNEQWGCGTGFDDNFNNFF